MTESNFILNGEGNFFLQQELSEEFVWLTCTGVGDIGIPQGDRTPVYCADPLNSGQFQISGFVRGDPAAGTYTLEKPLASTWNVLLEVLCDFQGRINWVCRGNRMNPSNYEVAVVMVGSEFSSKGIANPVRTPEGTMARVNTNGNVEFLTPIVLYRLNISQHTLSNTADGNGIFFMPYRCEDRCGPARGLLEHGLIGCDNPSYPGYLYDSDVKKTVDGSSWAAVATDPYAYGGGTKGIQIFETIDSQKYVTFRYSQVPGFPAECAISTDGGDTWANVPIGAVNNQAVLGVGMCQAAMFVACTGGYIYSSIDQGTSWTVESAGALTTEDLRDVRFYNDRQGYIVGDNNVFLYTQDGGNTWYAGTGPAAGVDLLSVAVNRKGFVFVSTNDGRVFYSEDEGDTWTVRVNMGAGSIPWIRFDDAARYIGGFVHNPASGRAYLYRSENGGASWWQIAGMPNNSGLNWGFIGDANHIAVVGNAHSGSTFVASTAPSG